MISKTEATLINRAQFQKYRVSGEGWTALLNRREVAAGRNLAAADLCEFRNGKDINSVPSEYFPAIRWFQV